MKDKFVFVDGVQIKLTVWQINIIEKEISRRLKCKYSFRRMLLRLGFRKIKDLPDSFQHKAQGWYAEIIDRGNYSDCWVVGPGLKEISGFPGGWVYESPKEIEAEIMKALETK